MKPVMTIFLLTVITTLVSSLQNSLAYEGEILINQTIIDSLENAPANQSCTVSANPVPTHANDYTTFIVKSGIPNSTCGVYLKGLKSWSLFRGQPVAINESGRGYVKGWIFASGVARALCDDCISDNLTLIIIDPREEWKALQPDPGYGLNTTEVGCVAGGGTWVTTIEQDCVSANCAPPPGYPQNYTQPCEVSQRGENLGYCSLVPWWGTPPDDSGGLYNLTPGIHGPFCNCESVRTSGWWYTEKWTGTACEKITDEEFCRSSRGTWDGTTCICPENSLLGTNPPRCNQWVEAGGGIITVTEPSTQSLSWMWFIIIGGIVFILTRKKKGRHT